MSSNKQEDIRKIIEKNRPDFASLFGSVELCDCKDCRSIYSPAAYFVDLLHFLDPPKFSGITPLDVLIGNSDKKIVGRRPDLAHIQLSCENTNTTLPYVDLVNEVLESYVAVDQTLPLLTDVDDKPVVPPVAEPNESSPGVTTAELAANPENTRYLAYKKLQAAVYPLTLPFNQPIAALRLTLEQMGTSRHEVMGVFGKKGDEAADRALDVEALKLTEGEFAVLTNEQFDGTPAIRPITDFYGFEMPLPQTKDTAWINGAVPTGAKQQLLGDTWAFAAFVPPPDSGAVTHTSTVAPGLHQHFFENVPDVGKLKVENEDLLFAEIFLDPDNLPQQIMLQWNDGTWEHRAYWGPSTSLIVWGVEGTASSRYMGPLPAAGKWLRLEVPAYFVGLAGRELSGMAFTLFGGGATWGAAGKRSPSWVELLTHVPMFLAKTGVSYVDLIELVKMHFINPNLPQGKDLEIFEKVPFSYATLEHLVQANFAGLDEIALLKAGIDEANFKDWAIRMVTTLGKLIVLDAPDSACDLTLTRLQNLDGTPLDDVELSRLHRFIRLWRKSGWTVHDLDRAISALQAPDITPAFLRQLGHIVQLQAILELSPQQLLSFWGAIPTAGDHALYSKLFLNKAVRDIDPKFASVNGEYLRPADNLKIKDHVPALLAGLRTRAADLALIREHTKLTGDDAPLILATATVLYRYVTLARALKMAVKDLIALMVLSGDRPFSTLSDSNDGFKDIDPAQTIHFVHLAERVEQSGFTPANLSYLFSKLADAPSNLAPGDETIQLFLTNIREGLVRIAAENVPIDDPTGEVTRARLGMLFEAHVVEQISGFIAGTRIYTVPLATLPAGVSLPEGKVTYDDMKSHLLTASDWLTDTEKAALLALSNVEDYQKTVNSLYDQPRELLNETLVKRLGWTNAETYLKASVLEKTSLGADGKLDPALVAGKFKTFLAGALPYFRKALSGAFVKQTLANALNIEPATTALLLESANGITLLGTDADISLPAIDDFLTLIGDGLTATYFEKEALAGPSVSQLDPGIDFQWDARHGFSVMWEGTLMADKTQRYHLHLRAGGSVKLTIDGKPLIDQQEDTAPVEYTTVIDLESGKRYDLKLEYSNHEVKALIELRWSGPATPAQIVPSYRIYSTARGDVAKAAQHTYIRLHKASLLVNGFKLAPHEIAYLAHPGNPDAFDLNKLPVEAAPADQQALFAAWLRWNDFTTLRAVARANPPSLLDVFIASTAMSAQTALVRATGWDAGALAGLAGTQGFNLQDPDYKDTEKLLKLADAMRLLALLRAPAAEVFRWAAYAPSMEHTREAAQEAKRAHKARYDNDAWLEIARPVADRLRESQRTALVAYLLPKLGYTDPDKLFEHFLIDVEMSPCMLTSRIKQAISSVQLFVQRCRMNLEQPQVSPKMIDGILWEWMKNYRVWEANRKVFLYPENWIEPELRDDKSPFFRELESELLQAEVTNDTAEIALGNYLEKLDTVSHLQICGMYEQTDTSDEKRESVLHVFGHTFATPRVFYYRQLVTVNPNYRYWTAWEKVPLDIEADEVLPVIWNRRLYLFWQVITEKVDVSKQIKTSMIRLAYTEYRHGKWSAKQVTAIDHALEASELAYPPRMNVKTYGDELTIVFEMSRDAFIYKGTGQRAGHMVKRIGSLTFRNCNGLVNANSESVGQVIYPNGYLPPSSPSTSKLELLAVADEDRSVPVFEKVPSTIQVFAPGSKPYTLNDPFFLQEGPRAYLVMPHSFLQSKIERLVGSKDLTPYLPGNKAKEKAFDTTKDVGRPLMAQLSLLNTNANSWLSGPAGIAATEIRAFSAPAPASQFIKPPILSMDSQIFHHGSFKEVLELLFPAEFKFETFFHPYTAEFQRRLNRFGVSGLLNIDSQKPGSLPKVTSFGDAYVPNKFTVKESLWPKHDVDFKFSGAYSLYNWEIFFHVPLFMATRLSQNQRFEEAMRWFHFIFDPTTGSPADPVPQCYWNVLPFRETQPQRLNDMLKGLHAGDKNVIAQWEDLQAHPFEPHRIARLRLIAYQKTVVMKYIDNLFAWGDQLFRRDTIESINQATQLYVLASTLLGPRVQRVPPRGRNIPKTYAQLRQGLNEYNQAIVSFENDMPFSNRATSGESSPDTIGLLGIGRTFYFCLPKNDKLLGYWDTVADRLFKIRHCMNIEGVVRELPLFEPPIDPALLVQAAVQGIDLSSVLSDLSAPLPYYRFNTLHGKALEMTAELRSLGVALLAALEKRDAEHLSNLRASHETELLSLVKQVKQQQLTEAQTAEAALQKSREVTQTRFDFYTNIPQRIAEETNQLLQLEEGRNFQRIGQTAENIITDLERDLPDITTGWSYTTTGGWNQIANITWGRSNVIAHYRAQSRSASYDASVRTSWANDSSILGGWSRRAHDWKLQEDLAFKELAQIDKQIAAAHIRVDIAQKELDNTTRQIEQSQEIHEFLRNKYTGEELYNWMVGEISTIFFQCYQMTYDLAKKAERCYRFERGLVTSNFIQFGAWDSMRKGLLSGERLYLQLKQMERAYLDGNRREYELTKHYSLVQNHPLGLIHLKEQGWCEIELPETLFDIDFPGHYMRRVKSVSLTIPAVIGPYTGINCTLTLLRDRTRVKSTMAEGYSERDGEEDDRFMTSWTRMQSIVTSSGQNDSGMFELNFRDERYLPFEGAGVISRWRIELPRELRQFDYDTISDVVLHIKYTAREGGVPLRDAAIASLKQQLQDEEGKPQARLFSLRHEFPTEWHQLQSIADSKGDHSQAFSLAKNRFPFVFQGGTITVNRIEIFGIPKDRMNTSPAPESEWKVTPPPPAPDAVPLDLKGTASEGLLIHKVAATDVEVKNPDPIKKEVDWTIQVLKDHVPASLDRLEDILLLCHYSVVMSKKP